MDRMEFEVENEGESMVGLMVEIYFMVSITDCLNLWVMADRTNQTARIQKCIREEFNLIAVSKNDVQKCLESGSARKRVKSLIVSSWHQQNKAERVFAWLDNANKGLVVAEDLQRNANDILGDDVSNEDLEDMLRMADPSGEGMCTKKMLCRLARKINL